MLKVSLESVASGAVLARPITNDAGIVLIAAGAEIYEPLKRRLAGMGITEVFIVGRRVPDISKAEFVDRVNRSFAKSGEDPRMAAMKNALLAHIEEVY
jgi:hypothetical protein